MTVEEFKVILSKNSVDTITREVILSGEPIHVSTEDCNYLRKRLAETYNVALDETRLWIVGSAKLGFSISEKRLPDRFLPRFRPYRPESDIDVAVVSPPIFDQIWTDLSRHASGAPRLPWYSGDLGAYLVHGWLRPDHFPRHARLRRCDDWWDLFRGLSREARFGRRSVRGGLFYSLENLVHYQSRSVRDCLKAMEL